MLSVCQRLSPCKPLQTPLKVHAFSSKYGNEFFCMIRSGSCYVSHTFMHIPNEQPWRTNSYQYDARECRNMAALNDNKENFSKQLGLKDLQPTVVLNEVRPPVRGVFEASKAGVDEVKEGNIFEKGAAFIGNKVIKKAEAVQKAWVSLEEVVAPTQYAPIQGEDTSIFIFIRLAALPLFSWLQCCPYWRHLRTSILTLSSSLPAAISTATFVSESHPSWRTEPKLPTFQVLTQN